MVHLSELICIVLDTNRHLVVTVLKRIAQCSRFLAVVECFRTLSNVKYLEVGMLLSTHFC